jgi:hypothetical protein
MKHTPGPWKVDRFEDKPHQRRHTVGGNSLMICDTWSMWEDEETEANAHLIAAAPDLLGACKAVNAWLDQPTGKIIKSFKQLAELSRLSGIVRQAISRAEGRE